MEPIPKSVRVNTGEQGKVIETIDNFFVSTKDYIVDNRNGDLKDFEIRLEHMFIQGSSVPSNDAVHKLLYKQNVVAAVIETRTEFNHIQYDFFRNLDNIL